MIIYKYLDEKGTKKTINRKSVLLSRPSAFNDPFDCVVNANGQEKNDAFKLG